MLPARMGMGHSRAVVAGGVGGGPLPTIWTADGSSRTVNGTTYPATRTFLGSGDWAAISRAGDASNNTLQGYASNHVFVNGSNQLEIKGDNTDITYGATTFHYTTGSIYTPALTFTTGTFEAKLQVSGSAWPAWWFLGANCQSTWPITADDMGACQWPQDGSDEIDAFDLSTSDRTHIALATFMASGNGNGGSSAVGFDMSAAMHTYTLIRTASTLTLKVDGTTRGTLSGSVVPSSAMIMILEMAVNAATSGFTSTSMLVDYVAVY